MKPGDNLNNLSRVPRAAPLDSTTENNYLSDSDIEVAAGDLTGIIQYLKRTIKRNQAKINDLAAKLAISDILLASEREKTRDKEEVIKSLKLSIDLNTQINDLKLKSMQMQLESSQSQNVNQDTSGRSGKDIENAQYIRKIEELNADIEIMECKLKIRNTKLSELDDKTEKYEVDLTKKDDHIAKLESQIKLSLESNQKHECNLTEKDEQIAKLESQMETYSDKIKELSKFRLEASQDDIISLIFLSCLKIPFLYSIQLPNDGHFTAVLEDLPSAGPGWMVIQRRSAGRFPFHNSLLTDYSASFGDIRIDFWLGCEKLYELTSSRRHELYIELVGLNGKSYARYDNFVVGSKTEKYRLKSLGEYSGNAGNYLTAGENTEFDLIEMMETDREKDTGGWWSNQKCNLNGERYWFGSRLTFFANEIWWGFSAPNYRIILKSCRMLIRPKP